MTPKKTRRALAEGKADYLANRRASERDLFIPDIKDPQRRQQLEDGHPTEWLSFYFPDVFYNPFTDEQLRTIDDLTHVMKYGSLKCKAAPRGDGKSTLLKYLLLRATMKTERDLTFSLIVTATNGKSDKLMASIRQRLASRQPMSWELAEMEKKGRSTKGMTPNHFADDYPLECLAARRVQKSTMAAKNLTGNGREIAVKWGSDGGYFILPTWADEEPVGPIFMALSWQSDELQGCNVMDRRPDFVGWDDLDSRESLTAEDGKVAGKICEVIDKTGSGLGGQSKRLGQYFICTITSEDAAAAKYSDPKQKPEWKGQRTSAIVKWPDDIDLWDQYIEIRQRNIYEGDPDAREAHQFYVDRFDEMNKGAEVSNPYNFDATELEDGSQNELSCLQMCFNYISKYGREAFDTEYQNQPPAKPDKLEARVNPYIVSACSGDYPRRIVDSDAEIITAGVDIRKVELHYSILSSGLAIPSLVPDYHVMTHPGASQETTVQEAEHLVLAGLHAMADEWESEPIEDADGTQRACDLALIDAAWDGSYKDENGETKTWITQPVETFCRERGVRRWLPAIGVDKYKKQEPSKDILVGDNWHIRNVRGRKGKSRAVIWNVEHWKTLVEEKFILSEDDKNRFVLFDPPRKLHWKNHKRLGEHIRQGAEELADYRMGKRKRKWRRDHWWDSFAMMLVAHSVELALREREQRKRPSRSLAEMAQEANR